ncbi:MAG: hypothetical protein WBO09_16800 [Methylocystis silviterrae]|uniref:hypothetical protein n=1 Tax=Methylocystis silviterrae TaxID=2743612 RepID=UPI003C766C51
MDESSGADHLATTLMDYVVVFRAGDDDFGVMLTAAYDGNPNSFCMSSTLT